MSRRDVTVIGFALVALAGLAVACGRGKAPETPATTSQATEAAPPAQAANDPAPAAQPLTETYNPADAAGAVKGVPAPTNTAPIEAVANYYLDLPGYDLKALPQAQREKMLQRVNSELCTCGCKHETLAFCLVNDAKCPSVKGLVETVYQEVKSGR